MPLDKQPVFIPLAVGLQSEVIDKLVQPGQGVLELENAYQTRQGEIVKRNGSDSLSLVVQPDSGTLRQPFAVASHQSALVSLSAPGSDPIAVYSPTRAAWSKADSTLGSIKTDRRGPILPSITKVSAGGYYPEVAYSAGYYFVTYRGTDNTPGVNSVVHQCAIDATTGHKVIDRTITVAVTGITLLKVAVVNGYAVFMHSDGTGAIIFDTYAIATLGTAGPTITTAGSASLSSFALQSDVHVKNGTTLAVVYATTTPRVSGVDFVPSTGGVTYWSLLDQAGATVPAEGGAAWVQDFGGTGKDSIITVGSAAGVLVHYNVPASGATRQASTTMPCDATPGTVTRFTGHTTSNSVSFEFVILYDVVGSPFSKSVIKSVTRVGSFIGSPVVLYRSVALRSKTFTHNGDYFVVGEFAHGSDNISTRYLLRVPFTSAPAPLVTTEVGSGYAQGDLTSVAVNAAGQLVTAMTTVVRLDREAGAPFNPDFRGVELLTFTFGAHPNTTLGPAKEAIGSLFVPGGNLGQFDGTTYAEAGFAYPPEQGTLTAQTSGSMTASSTYWYRYTYAYTDAQGRVWRSGPSVPQSVALGASNQGVLHAIPTLRITGRLDAVVEIWRPAANQVDTYQKVGQVPNSTTADTVAYLDGASDTALASGEFAPWNGGLVTSDVTPGFSFVAVFKDRVFGVSADDPQVLYYSAPSTIGQGLLLSEVFTQDVRDHHGPITGLAALGDALIIFKKDAVYALGGDGPNLLNQGGYQLPQLIGLGIGCDNRASIVETADAVWFRSSSTRAGIHAINRGLSVEYVGAGVRRYNSLTITGAVVVPYRQQIRFYTSEGRTLVFDQVAKNWSTWTGQDACSAVAVGDGVVYARPSTAFPMAGQVMQESTTSYTEGTIWYSMKVVSPWLSIAGVDGWERIYRIQGVGTTAGYHTLTAKLYANYDDSTVIATSTKQCNLDWIWELRPSIQKLSAMKVELTETRPGEIPIIVAAGDNVDPTIRTWFFANASFDSTYLGSNLIVTGAAHDGNNGTFIIMTVTDAHTIVTVPGPVLVSEFFDPSTVTVTAQGSSFVPTAGPAISGISTIVGMKSGLRKLGSGKRLATQ